MICDQCETVAHCMKHGCVPKQPMPIKDEALKLALEALVHHEGNYKLDKAGAARSNAAITAIKQALAVPVQEPVAYMDKYGEIYKDVENVLSTDIPLYTTPPAAQPAPVQDEWTPCMKLPVVVYVRKQRPGEAHVSTREGITPVKPDDLIMRGVLGEEYPIGRAIFEQTYTLNTTPPASKPLTEGEIQKLLSQNRFAVFALVRAIEAAHGIKENT